MLHTVLNIQHRNVFKMSYILFRCPPSKLEELCLLLENLLLSSRQMNSLQSLFVMYKRLYITVVSTTAATCRQTWLVAPSGGI